MLIAKGHQITNYGTDSVDSVDYPDFGHPANDVTEGKADLGIVSGSGNGMTVNKHAQVRAALCWKRLHFQRQHTIILLVFLLVLLFHK
jgi:ribose 5-phosphate isomerase B